MLHLSRALFSSYKVAVAWQQRAILFLSHSTERGTLLLSLSLLSAPHCCPLALATNQGGVCACEGVP